MVLQQAVFWLAAGMLNVRAKGSFQYPEEQKIGELKLNFIQLSKKASDLQIAIINMVPLLAGVLCVWFIANNVFDIPVVLDIIAPGTISAVGAGLAELLRTPDFWLWFYVTFTIANTMIPDLGDLAGIRYVFPALAVAIVVFIVIGVGNEVVVAFLGGPVATVLNVLSTTFAVVIAIDSFVVGVLAIIENTIEVITGDSADFRRGKMVTMTREQRLSRRKRKIEKQRKARQDRLKQIASTEEPPSIYKFPLPLPGAPDDELPVTAVSNVMLEDDDALKPPSLPEERESRAGASLVTGKPDNSNQPQNPDKPQLTAPDAADEES